jgi:3-deoxy-D-manno-octulosonate 8-phosphate phosphatase (KDO 8-P phosphatase)
MVYTEAGKVFKIFGCDDWCALEMIKDFTSIHFITADKKGFPITQRRIEDECGYNLDLVSGNGIERWRFIYENYPDHEIIFMGDGINDDITLCNSNYSITTCDALDHTKKKADYVTVRPGGNRAVAEAVLHLLPILKSERPLENFKRHPKILQRIVASWKLWRNYLQLPFSGIRNKCCLLRSVYCA